MWRARDCPAKPQNGKMHCQLGALDCTEKGKQCPHEGPLGRTIGKMLNDFKWRVETSDKQPQQLYIHCCKINGKIVKIKNASQEEFHSQVAKCQFLSRRTPWPNLWSAASFFMHRSWEDDEDDWTKPLFHLSFWRAPLKWRCSRGWERSRPCFTVQLVLTFDFAFASADGLQQSH